MPLFKNPAATWPDRTLFTHVGRWPRFSEPDAAKFANCSVRTPRWHLVSVRGGAQPAWELYDLDADHGEQKDVAAWFEGLGILEPGLVEVSTWRPDTEVAPRQLTQEWIEFGGVGRLG